VNFISGIVAEIPPTSWGSKVMILVLEGLGTIWGFGMSISARKPVGDFHDWVTPSLSFPSVAMIAPVAIAPFSEGNFALGFRWY
jgi:hypothetical protein